MGLQQSKTEQLYQQAINGNIEGIKALHREGARLEWIDKEGKTPLIVACMNPELYNVAKTLIDLGANVNAFRQGRHAGTPLHHAAKRGLDQTVKLLLSHGANALVMNDDCQTPLDVARFKGYSNVVRTIEAHICLFSGWLKELHGPGFLEKLASQFLSRKIWVVVVPCGSRTLKKPLKLELAVYTALQDAQPRTIVALWKANMDEPNFNHPEPAAVITDNSTMSRRWRKRRGITYKQVSKKTRLKIAALSANDKPQLQRFCNACKGISQVSHSTSPFNAPEVPVLRATRPANCEDVQLSKAIDASIQSLAQPGSYASSSTVFPPVNVVSAHSDNNCISVATSSKMANHDVTVQHIGPHNVYVNVQATAENPIIPSAPPAGDDDIVDDTTPIHYPTIEGMNTPVVGLSSPHGTVLRSDAAKPDETNDSKDSSSCVICLDSPVEGACIPCGHMAGCMSCLNEVKAKKWGCPVCRANIDQVVRLYAV